MVPCPCRGRSSRTAEDRSPPNTRRRHSPVSRGQWRCCAGQCWCPRSVVQDERAPRPVGMPGSAPPDGYEAQVAAGDDATSPQACLKACGFCPPTSRILRIHVLPSAAPARRSASRRSSPTYICRSSTQTRSTRWAWSYSAASTVLDSARLRSRTGRTGPARRGEWRSLAGCMRLTW